LFDVRTRSLLRNRALTGALLALALAGCGGHGLLSPRFVAVHNAMAAMGMAQTGSISEGSLEHGAKVRFDVPLEAGHCYTFVALGSSGVRDLDLRILGEDDTELGRDVTHDPQAAAQACPRAAGSYQVELTMSGGQGGYAVSSWEGAAGRSSGGSVSAGVASSAGDGEGTCQSPLPLALGAPAHGDTTGGANALSPSCIQGGTAPERVYEIQIEQRAQLVADLSTGYDGALYLRAQCGAGEDIACNDDAGGSTTRSHVDATLDPGTYYLVVDGYGDAAGTYDLVVQATPLRALSAVCGAADALPLGQPVSGTTEGSQDYFQATCGGGARAPDHVYRLDITQRSRLRVRQESNHDGVLYMRRSCAEPTSEFACNDDLGDTRHSEIRTVVDPGTYFVYSDGYSGGDQPASGSYTIRADTAPEAGGSAAGETCQAPLALRSGTAAQIDTFEAGDDYSGSCGGQGAPDVVYGFDLTARSRVEVRVANPAFTGAMYVQRTCGDTSTEVACGAFTPGARAADAPPQLDTILPRGHYVLVIDGANAEEFGSAEITLQVSDVAALERACAAAPLLHPGHTENGTTVGGQDRFHASCAEGTASNDVMYRLRLTRRSTVRISMSSDFDGALYLRRDCTDGATEVVCNDDTGDNRHSQLDTTLDAGTYFVFVDGFRSGNQGSYSLDVQVTRP